MVSVFRNRVKQIPSRERFRPTTVFEEVFEMWRQLPNLPKQVPCELKASGPSGPVPSDGSSCWPDGDHSNPANQLLRKYLAMNQPPAWGVCCFCWSWWFGHMSTWTIGSRHSLIWDLQKTKMMKCCIVRSWFSWLSPVFHEGCAENPLQVLPNFPHDIHDHCAGRLDGTCDKRFFLVFFLVIDLDDFASKKHDLDPPPQPVTKKV